jgi:hypothetical protein
MNVQLVLGLVCLVLSSAFHPARLRHLKSTMPEIHAAARAGQLRAPLAVHLLGLLGFALTIWGFWREWFGHA